MNRCPTCGETSEPQFTSCWKCGTEFPFVPPRSGVVKNPNAETSPPPRRRPVARFRQFRGTFSTWTSLLTDAAAFATEVGRDRLITISHSEDKDDGLVVVWYWDDDYTKESA